MTKLTELMDQGWKIMISDQVKPDTMVAWNEDDTEATIVFHPLNYNYVSQDDPFVAHEMNLQWIQENVIDRLADQALARLDRMVDEMNRQYEPQVVTFLPHTTVQENEDGSFTFFAAPAYTRGEGGVVDLEGLFNDLPEGAGDDHIRLNEEYYRHSTSINNHSTYDQLKEALGREPTSDELFRGWRNFLRRSK